MQTWPGYRHLLEAVPLLYTIHTAPEFGPSGDAGDPRTAMCPAATWRKEGAGTQVCRLSHAGGLPTGRGTGYFSRDPQRDGTPVSPKTASRLSSTSDVEHLLLHPSPCCSQAGALSRLPLPHQQDGNPFSSFRQLWRAQGGEIR